MLLTIVINSFLVAAAVLIHFEALNLLSIMIPKLPIKNRLSILFGVFGAIIAHVIEIWLFAFGYFFMIQTSIFGALTGNFDNSLLDCAYFSFTSYTSLGFGDIQPIGNLRFLSGLEALTGLVLIAWTASFMFFEMEKLWKASR
ncbi:MAG: ion channel [Pseudomonadota bacterium]